MDDGHQPTERWSVMAERARELPRQARRFVYDRPLQAIALTIGVGFLMGKIFGGRHE